LLSACGKKKEEHADSERSYNDFTDTATTLSAPENFSITAGVNKVTLDWDTVSRASSYMVYWGTSTGISSSSIAITSISTDNYTHSSLTNGTTYYYKVATVNSSGIGTLSSEANATPSSFSTLMGAAIQGSLLSLCKEGSLFAGLADNMNGMGTDDGQGPDARFCGTYDITTDGTNLYLVEKSGSRIRKIVIATSEVTTLAGSGDKGYVNATGENAKFWGPSGVTTDGTNIYITDSLIHSVRKIQ